MSNYQQFAARYRVRNMQVVRDRDYQTINYSYRQPTSYYTDREDLIEMELTRSGFEDLVNMDNEYTRLWQDQKDEAYLRKMHPALAEAYSKYRMLLEIYK